MQFTFLAVSAFAASVLAAPPAASSSENLVSVLSVLQTALPSSLVAEALTNSAAASSQIVSEFSAGHTPTWFTALPSDIQTYLVPAVTNPAALSSVISSANITAAPNATALSSISTMIHNSTAISAGQSSILASIHRQNSSVISRASLGTSTAGGASTAGSGSGAGAATATSGSVSSSSSGAASMPTGIVGMGLAGAVGLVGLFAL